MAAKLNPEQMEAVARMFGVLAEPTRLAILQVLQSKAYSVGELVEQLGARQANISKQLGILFAAGLVARERDGNTVYYSVREPMIFELCELVCNKLRRDADRQLRTFSGRQSRSAH